MTNLDKSTDTRYDICPECGEIKRVVAKTCKQCRYVGAKKVSVEVLKSVRRDLITPEWISEFRGLFWGEGSAMIVPNNNSYSTIISLGLRSDDKAVLVDIYEKLGGSVVEHSTAHRRNPLHGTQLQWRVTSIPHVLEICRLLLASPLIPAKKVGDVRLVMSFCEWRIARYTCPITPEERQEMKRRHEELTASRLFIL